MYVWSLRIKHFLLPTTLPKSNISVSVNLLALVQLAGPWYLNGANQRQKYLFPIIVFYMHLSSWSLPGNKKINVFRTKFTKKVRNHVVLLL